MEVLAVPSAARGAYPARVSRWT